MLGFNGGLIGKVRTASILQSVPGVWTLQEQAIYRGLRTWPGGWTPANISTALWLDATDSTTITESSGAVSQWNDKSGNGRNATASSTARPTTGTRTINSLNVLDFNGSSNSMTFATAPMSGTSSGMAVYVVQLDNDPPTVTTTGGPVLGDWGLGGAGTILIWTDGNIYDDFLSNSRNAAGNPTPSFSTAPALVSVVSASGLWEIYVNGSLLFSTTSNTYRVGTSPKIGHSSTNGNIYVDGRVAEIAVVANSTSSTTRQLLEGYMAGPARWNLQSSLPSDHPYRNVAP